MVELTDLIKLVEPGLVVVEGRRSTLLHAVDLLRELSKGSTITDIYVNQSTLLQRTNISHSAFEPIIRGLEKFNMVNTHYMDGYRFFSLSDHGRFVLSQWRKFAEAFRHEH